MFLTPTSYNLKRDLIIPDLIIPDLIIFDDEQNSI